jgi:hypothetical protein
MKQVWKESSAFKYRKILRDEILNKADRALKGRKMKSKKSSNHGKNSSQAKSVKSRKTNRGTRRGSRMTKTTFKSKSRFGEEGELNESDEVLEETLSKGTRNLAKSSKYSKSRKRRSISSHITNSKNTEKIMSIPRKMPRKSILMRRKSHFGLNRNGSNEGSPNIHKEIKKQRKSVMIALPTTHLVNKTGDKS